MTPHLGRFQPTKTDSQPVSACPECRSKGNLPVYAEYSYTKRGADVYSCFYSCGECRVTWAEERAVS